MVMSINEIKQVIYEAWECTKKLRHMDYSTLYKVFKGDDVVIHNIQVMGLEAVFEKYSASEAIDKVKEYEEKQKQTDGEIKVGDEIERIKGNKGRKYIVTKIIESDYINIIFDDGGVGYVNPIHYRKTGRRFPQIEEVLKQIQEDKYD